MRCGRSGSRVGTDAHGGAFLQMRTRGELFPDSFDLFGIFRIGISDLAPNGFFIYIVTGIHPHFSIDPGDLRRVGEMNIRNQGVSYPRLRSSSLCSGDFPLVSRAP